MHGGAARRRDRGWPRPMRTRSGTVASACERKDRLLQDKQEKWKWQRNQPLHLHRTCPPMRGEAGTRCEIAETRQSTVTTLGRARGWGPHTLALRAGGCKLLVAMATDLLGGRCGACDARCDYRCLGGGSGLARSQMWAARAAPRPRCGRGWRSRSNASLPGRCARWQSGMGRGGAPSTSCPRRRPPQQLRAACKHIGREGSCKGCRGQVRELREVHTSSATMSISLSEPSNSTTRPV
jgi:hypothetical protein